jgi:hypothetical protein
MLRRVAVVRTDVSEEPSASSIRVTRIGELGTTLAVTSNRLTLHVPPKRRFLQEPHGVTSQKTPFFNSLLEYFLLALPSKLKDSSSTSSANINSAYVAQNSSVACD